MRVGVFISDVSGGRTGVEGLLDAARDAEARGFATAWVPHIMWSLDGLIALALSARVTSRIELGTAVMPTYPRHPYAMAQQALSVQAASGGRLALGIGPSHPGVIEGMHGLAYERPARHTREYVEVLRAAMTGQVDYTGELLSAHSFLDLEGASPAPILVAALAPLMLQVAGEVADGTITYWANERAVGEHIVPRLTAAAAAAGRPAPRVVVGLPVAVVADADAAHEKAARMFSVYLGLPAYQRIFERGGGVGPADVAVIGDEAHVRARLHAYADAGMTDLAAVPLGLDDDRAASTSRTLDLLASLPSK